MKRNVIYPMALLIVLILTAFANRSQAQYNFKNSGVFLFQKNEIDWGLHYYASTEREEIRTELWREYEELATGPAKFQFKNRFWNFLDYKQERFEFNIEAGPLWGNGNWIDSSAVANIEAGHKIFGLRTNASANYASRYYYNNKNYTLVQINGWARYDLYRQNSTGISTGSDKVVSSFEEETKETKFRYGTDARAGWGIGRLNPMNYFMVADYFLKKYHNERNYSQEEITRFANEIGRIKNQRNIKTGHKADVEFEQIQEYLNKKMFLIRNENLETDWETGEFLPRFNGNRVEVGPFFKYYNREPDFIYGGYALYENAKYCRAKWNRNFSAGVNYNAYKKQDWILAELGIGWSYFIKLKSQFDFGFKYVPGIALDGSEDVASINNGFIPYVGYFTQIDPKNRIDIKLAYRISEDEKLMLSGPEFSVTVYRSSY